MKKSIYYILFIILILSSCDPMDKIYDEMSSENTGYKNNVEYTLTADDYDAIAKLATGNYPVDAAFISSKMFFNDTITASKYVPAFLAELYPALSVGSSAMVTYNYNGEMPEDLSVYTSTDTYTVKDSDYKSIDGVLQVVKYYSPGYSPELYIPLVLSSEVEAPSNGDLMLVSYNYSTADPQVDFSNVADDVIWQEDFSGSLGTFTQYDLLGAQSWVAASYGSDEYAKISGYASGNQDNEDWLISGPIDLTGISNASLNFRETAKYVNDQWDQLRVLISADWDGTQAGIATATWDTLSGYNLPTGNDYTFVESGKIDLSSYADKTIHIAFRYVSTTANAATWEVDMAEIVVPGTNPPVTGLSPQVYKDFYEYTGSAWAKANNIYYVNAADYNAMGSPGKYDDFSSSDLPKDYLPALLTSKYPLAGEGSEVVVVYKYYEGGLLTLADRYSFTNGNWVSSYDYVEPKTSQFLYSTDGWVFDPTVNFTMVNADYQLVVDWVKNNIGADKVDSYGTQEFYTGAGSYYNNYDLRDGKWDSSVFSTWQDALKYSIGNILLPAKFPNAVAQVSGIDVFYVVTFATYNGSNATYSMKFQCTKSGPDPEFTFVEGPY